MSLFNVAKAQTKSETIHLDALGTQTINYEFYFPEEGTFSHYGARVIEEDNVVAAAEVPSSLKVVEVASEIDKSSWLYVSQCGSHTDVLPYLKEHNIEGQKLDLTQIAWRMKDKEFAKKHGRQ